MATVFNFPADKVLEPRGDESTVKFVVVDDDGLGTNNEVDVYEDLKDL